MGSVSKMSGNRRKSWRARVTISWEFDPDLMCTRQIQKTLGYYSTRTEALKALMDYNMNPFDLDILNITFEDCYKEAEKDFTDGRKGNYQAAHKYLEPIKDIPIRSIKANQMQRCIDSCDTTQQVEIKTVCHKVFDYAMRMEIVERDPSKYLKSNTVTHRKREIRSCEQVQNLESIEEWWSKIVLMLLYSGMRTKELKELKPEWIDIDNACIDIQKAKNRSSLRQIPIHAHVLPLFCDYKQAGSNLYGYTHDGLNKALKAFCGHTAHDCRHTFTSRLRECGCDPLVLQLLLGHTPQSITERVYTHVSLAELSESINKLDYSV